MNDEKLTTDDIACLISGIDKPKTGHWDIFQHGQSVLNVVGVQENI